MKPGIFAFLLLGFLLPPLTACAVEVDAPVEQTLTRELDVTGDGLPDVISLHLVAENFNSPFRWTLTIASKGKDIYSVERDDSWFDEFFNRDDFVSGCKGYEECKRKYYFKDFPRIIIPKALYDEPGIMGDKGKGTIWDEGKNFLTSERRLDAAIAEKIIAAVLERYRTRGLPLISVRISPVKGDSPMIYVEEIEGFMPVYRE